MPICYMTYKLMRLLHADSVCHSATSPQAMLTQRRRVTQGCSRFCRVFVKQRSANSLLWRMIASVTIVLDALRHPPVFVPPRQQ